MADLPKTLRIGVDELLYASVTAGAQQTFALPPQMSNYRGVLVVQLVPVGGTLTAAVAQFEAALQPQGVAAATFGIFNKLTLVGGAPATLSSYSGFSLAGAIPIALDISGMGGNGLMRFNFTTFTLNTATSAQLYARVG
jgi:hypothetical protein